MFYSCLSAPLKHFFCHFPSHSIVRRLFVCSKFLVYSTAKTALRKSFRWTRNPYIYSWHQLGTRSPYIYSLHPLRDTYLLHLLLASIGGHVPLTSTLVTHWGTRTPYIYSWHPIVYMICVTDTCVELINTKIH